ncbi:MAG: MFS transporter [Hornefia sp.]|nr:MFS transporter [Hornefia sp.]
MKLKLSTKISYGIGGIADETMYTAAGTFLLFYLTSVVGIAPAAAGTIVAFGSVWEAVCGPVVGFMSDSIDTRYGKRKPFLVVAAIPVALITGLLFTTVNVSYGVKIIYYFIMTLLYWQSFATYFVPYLSWGSDLTQDYNERTVLRTFAYVFNQIGMAIGLILPTAFVDYLMNMGASRETGWMLTGFTIGLICAAALLICGLTIRDTDKKDPCENVAAANGKKKKKKKITGNIKIMLLEYREIVKLKPIRYIIGASLLYLIANTFFLSDRVYFFTYNQKLEAGEVTFIMILLTAAGIGLSPFIASLSKRFDKKNVFMCGVFFSGICLITAKFISVTSFAGSCIISCLYCIGNTSYWQLMPSMIYDVCEAEELFSGKKHSGQVISLQALSESLSIAIGSQLLGLLLQMVGFDSSLKEQSGLTLWWIDSCFSLIPGFCMILVALIVYRYPIDRSRFKDILDALEKRKSGVMINLEEFDDIYR